MQQIVKVVSYTDPSIEYDVNVTEKTCTCPAYQKKGGKVLCKHLLQVLGELDPKALASVAPSNSQVMSAMIKSIRLRWPMEASKWAYFLWRQKDQKSRLLRRIVICAAEDNLNTAVQLRAARFGLTMSHQHFPQVMGMIHRICQTPNWYAVESGRDYIEQFWLAHKQPDWGEAYTAGEDVLFHQLDVAAEDQNPYLACLAHDAYLSSGGNRFKLAHEIERLAKKYARKQAEQTIHAYLDVAKLLGNDSNYTGQAAYRLGAELGDQSKITPPPQSWLKEVFYRVKGKVEGGVAVPGYFLDGIHTGGNDPRFAGELRSMRGMGLAYQKYGRLHPKDPWPSSFRQ